MKKMIQKGFTLIELMIVVAIIAILAAIALPAYQDYTIRGQVSEGMSLTSGARTAVAEFYSNRGEFPANNASAGLAPAGSIIGQYVTNVAVVADGKINATFGNKANTKIATKVFQLTPTDQGGSVEWTCSKAVSSGTTIEDKYLPTSCR